MVLRAALKCQQRDSHSVLEYVLGDKNAFTASVSEITLSAVVYVEGARKSGGQ
jgi:hypothetical protein